MRCRACDVLLSDGQSVLKDFETGEYLDLCFLCKEQHEYVKQVMREMQPVILDTFPKPVLY